MGLNELLPGAGPEQFGCNESVISPLRSLLVASRHEASDGNGLTIVG